MNERMRESMESMINVSFEPLDPAVVEGGYLGILRYMVFFV